MGINGFPAAQLSPRLQQQQGFPQQQWFSQQPGFPQMGQAPGNNPAGIPGINVIGGNFSTAPVSLGTGPNWFNNQPVGFNGSLPATAAFGGNMTMGSDLNSLLGNIMGGGIPSGFPNQMPPQFYPQQNPEIAHLAPFPLELTLRGDNIASLLAARGLTPEVLNAPAPVNYESLLSNLKASTKDSNTNTIRFKTFDLNALRQLGDDASNGGNGDKVLSKSELEVSTLLLETLSNTLNLSGNKTLTDTLKTAKRLSKHFDTIGKTDGNTNSISAQDLVQAAQNDDDKALDTLNLSIPKKTSSKVTGEIDWTAIITKLLGQ